MQNMKDTRGALRTESLFVETISYASKESGYKPVYSLRDYDYKGYPSAYNIYMDAVDENEAALAIVGSLNHWRKLCKLKWFMDGRINTQFNGLNSWRVDMEARDKSLAKKTLMNAVKEGNITAAKALYALKIKTKAGTKTTKIDKTNSDVMNAIGNVVSMQKDDS